MAYKYLTDQNKADIVARLKTDIKTVEVEGLAREAEDYKARLLAEIAGSSPPDEYLDYEDHGLLKSADVIAVLDTKAAQLPTPTAEAGVL